MVIDFGTIFSAVITLYGEVTVDEAALEAGQTVPLPASLEVGSTAGKPVYLSGSLTTVKPAVGTPFPGGFSIANIFSDLVTIEGDISVDTAALDAGQIVPVPAVLTVGSTGGKPIYLVGSLSTTKS